MTRFPFLKMVLIGVACAGLATACERRGQGSLTVTTQAPTQAAQPTSPPPVAQPTSAPTQARATAAPTPTTVSQSDASADAVEESLQQVDTTLSSTDTADDLQDNAKEDAAGQALQQLGDELGNTDTLTDLQGNSLCACAPPRRASPRLAPRHFWRLKSRQHKARSACADRFMRSE